MFRAVQSLCTYAKDAKESGENTEGVYEKKKVGELLVLSSGCCYPGGKTINIYTHK